MNITTRLKMMSFMQYFIWGSWLVTLGAYMINTLHFTGSDVGMVYSSKGLAAIVMPSLVGIIADKWLRADRAYVICHLVCAAALCYAAQVNEPGLMFWIMLVNAMAFMPTIALSNTISYSCLEQAGLETVSHFPRVRGYGTVGFIKQRAALYCSWRVSAAGALFFDVAGHSRGEAENVPVSGQQAGP